MCWGPVYSVFEHFKLDVQAWGWKGYAHNKPPQCFMHILMSFHGTGDAACLRSKLIKAEKGSGLFALESWQLLQKSLLHPCWWGGGKLTSCQGGAIPNCTATDRNRLELCPATARRTTADLPTPSGACCTLSCARVHHAILQTPLGGCRWYQKGWIGVGERVLLQTTFLPDSCRWHKDEGLSLDYTWLLPAEMIYFIGQMPQKAKNKPIWWISEKLAKHHKLLHTLVFAF